MMNKRNPAFAAVLSVAILTGCSGSSPDAAPTDDGDRAAAPLPTEDFVPAPTSEPLAPNAPVPATINATDEAPPQEMPAPDEQMMDDAAATGMTARSPREEPAAAETAPAEQK